VGHFTLDNASNNGSMMTELTKLLNAKKIPFDGVDKRIMCFPHVINICCQHVITQFTNIELSESAVEYVADEYTHQVVKPLSRLPNVTQSLWPATSCV
jgi:hypothetical protein